MCSDVYGMSTGTKCECRKCGAELWQDLYTSTGKSLHHITITKDKVIVKKLLSCTEVMIHDIIQ